MQHPGLRRFRPGRWGWRSVLAIAAAVAAMLLVPPGHADPPAGPGDANSSDDWRPPSREHLWRTLLIGPVEGLTTDWHVAPDATAVPVGSVLVFRYKAASNAVFEWSGATEIMREGGTSWAICPALRPGPADVTIDVTVGMQHYGATCDVDVVPTQPQDITVSPIALTPDAMQIDETLPPALLNPITMSYYFGDSIAAVRPLGPGAWRTGVDRHLDVQVDVHPPEFAPLIEWRINGFAAAIGGQASVRIGVPGAHALSAGPPARERAIGVQTYDVTVHPQGDFHLIPEGEPVTFIAETTPPGFENEVQWLASTKYGTGVPVTGRGPTFTTQFDDTFGVLPDGSMFQWLGVKADGFAFGQDQKPNCLLFTVEAMHEAAGRPVFDSFPNGALVFDPVVVDRFGINGPCPDPPPTEGGGITNLRYNVTGNNLQQVSNNIFDLATGAGPLIEGRRYAGSATLSISPDLSFSVVDGNLCVQITAMTWTTKVLLPNWTPPKGTPQAQIDEWNRFRAALNTHEKGHAAINDANMPAVRARLVNQPAGKVVVPGTQIPNYDEKGEPISPEDMARDQQILTAAYALIDANASMVALENAQTAYDNPPSKTNPTGTDHGRTQGATLNPNP